MKRLLLTAAIAGATCVTHAELIISGAYDGPITGGVPKGVELYVSADIVDLSVYSLGFANNGGGTDGEEFTFPAVSVSAGEFIYVATEEVEFTQFFGAAPDYITSFAAINGDDAIELFQDGVVVDLFGDVDIDGTGQEWEYLDGWAKRDISVNPSPIFDIFEWRFSGPNALDGETSNATALTPYPFEGASLPSPTPTPTPSPTPTPTPLPSTAVSISEIHYDNEGADEGEGIELTAPANTDVSGWSIVLYNGNGGAAYTTEILTGVIPDIEGCDAGYLYVPISGIQNGSPDGIALIDASNNVVEFLSYEGPLTASDGPALGLTSVDIGVAETGTTEVGFSLQKIDGVWNEPEANTFGGCGADIVDPNAPLVKIHDIQGSVDAVAISTASKVSAIVTATYQSDDQLSGFFIQEEDADVDSDATTSEGLFVYCQTCPITVQVGDLVEVTGTPSDFNDMSQITATSEASITVVSSSNPLPSATPIDLPILGDVDSFYEAIEGMRVNFVDTMTVTEYFELGRFGEVVLAEGGRPRQFTDAFSPDEVSFESYQEELAARTIILDDVHDGGNFALFNDVAVYYPQPGGLSVDNYFRGGDTVDELSGVLQYAFSAWRIRPVSDIVFDSSNPRSESPSDVGGSLKVASFNVLNYFSTINETGTGCGPDATLECRGAHSSDELLRQTQKIVAAVCAIDADIIGLMEIENPQSDATNTAIGTLVDAINVDCGEYAALETGSVGSDAITVGFIYKPDTVELVGTTAILDDERFTDPLAVGSQRNRPAIAQSFKELATGSALTVAVNHLKSKGSSCGDGDDALDGQGNCNLTRAMAAQVQADWLAANPTGVDTEYALVIGDLNAYRYEDPITAFKDAGYTDLVDAFGGDDAYGYVFDGQVGYLDHALANDALFPYVTGATEWHINADEINLFDYDDTVLDAEEQSFEAKPSTTELFSADPYRSSDHDPVVIGLALPKVLTAADLPILFYDAVEAGTIDGVGRHWLWRYINRQIFANLLDAAATAVEKDKVTRACKSLNKADLFSSGSKYDLIEGSGLNDLNDAIVTVKVNLACTE